MRVSMRNAHLYIGAMKTYRDSYLDFEEAYYMVRLICKHEKVRVHFNEQPFHYKEVRIAELTRTMQELEDE